MPGGDTIPKTQCVINFGLFDITAKQDATFSTTDMMPFVSLSDLKVEGYEIPNPLYFPGYSWDGLDLLDLSWDEIDAKDLTWDEFESPDLRTWNQLEAYGYDWDDFDTLDRTWDELEGRVEAYAGYWSRSVSNRNGEFGKAVVDDFTWDEFDEWDFAWDELDAMDYAWVDLEGGGIPYLDITFTEDHSSAGLTFKFATLYEEWCTEVEATWYDKDGLFVGYVKARPDKVLQFAERKVENYRGIHINFLKTNKPYSHVKLTTIEFGVAQSLSGNDVINASLHEEISSTSAQLHINTLDCKIQNDESNFYVLNTVGVFSLLQERQTLEVTEIVDGVYHDMGTYYLDAMENESKNIVRIQAIDLMGIIDKSDFQGGIYNNVTVGSLISEIMTSAKAAYELDFTLENLRISGHIPICTHREALQQVVFSIGAIATTLRSNKIHIFSPKQSPTQVIPFSKKFYRKPVQLNELITGIDVTSYVYARGTEPRDLLTDTLEAGSYDITFTEPIYPDSIEISGENVSIIEKNANRVGIELSGRSDVVITGMPYVVQNRSYKTETKDLTSTTNPNIQYVESATMISPDRAQAIADRLYNYAQKRHIHTFGMVNEGQTPSDVIQVQHVDGGQIIGTVEIIDTDLTGGFRSDITVNFAYLIEQPIWDYTNDPVEIYTGNDIGVL